MADILDLQKVYEHKHHCISQAPNNHHCCCNVETSGYSPLHYAARAGHAEIVQLLITAGTAIYTIHTDLTIMILYTGHSWVHM